MEITPTLPRYQTRNSRWHPKFNSYNCNMFFAKIQLIQSLTRPTTHAAFSTFSTFSFLTIYSTRVLQHQKQTKYSMLQIKKTFFVVLLKRSFVIHLCCLKNIVLEKLTISRNAISSANGDLHYPSSVLIFSFMQVCSFTKRKKGGNCQLR